MQFHLTGDEISLHKTLEELVSLFEPYPVWILDESLNTAACSKAAKKINETFFNSNSNKHNIQALISGTDETKTNFRLKIGLKDEISGLYSASKITISGHKYTIVKPLNPPVDLQISSQNIIEAEFGIYTWQFNLESNLFYFSKEAADSLFGKKVKNLEYQDFYSALSIESLDRFSRAMEEAINLKKDFSIDLMIEKPGGNSWVNFICKSTLDNENGIWLTGLIKDCQKERTEEKAKRDLNLWLNSGLNKLEVKSSEGEIIGQWGNSNPDRGTTFLDGKRSSIIYDFRNKPKFSVVSEIQNQVETKSDSKVKEEQEESKSEAISLPTLEISVPESNFSKEEKCVAITKQIGISIDAQVSALGIFDGSRFEWKAWWKSPNKYALPIKKYSGEWLPELDWLVDVEIENQKFPDRYWWPQDMLPFEIGKSFGEGWMLIAEPISQKETSVLAIKTNTPEEAKKHTGTILQSLDALKPIRSESKGENSVQKLQAEIQEKDLAIKEINHRAKNNLALAASMVKMEAGYSENPEALFSLKQTQKRLETLASIHELLYKNPNSKETVDIKEYLTQLLGGLVSSFGNQDIELELQIDSVEIPMKKACTIGLLVNELVCNSFKYAFEVGKKGLLRVDFLDKGDVFKMRVTDNGPGIKKNEKDSLGKILIEEFVKQLEGNIEIDNSNGTTFFITFKK